MSKAPDLTTLAIPRKGAATPAASPPVAEAPPPDDPRTTVSTRLPISVQRRLRRCAYETERDKQGIIEAALDAYLRDLGF